MASMWSMLLLGHTPFPGKFLTLHALQMNLRAFLASSCIHYLYLYYVYLSIIISTSVAYWVTFTDLNDPVTHSAEAHAVTQNDPKLTHIVSEPMDV